jgi:hypothetical protein
MNHYGIQSHHFCIDALGHHVMHIYKSKLRFLKVGYTLSKLMCTGYFTTVLGDALMLR